MTNSVKHTAVEGAVFLIAQSVISRIAILLSQIILARLLSPQAFGVNAIGGVVMMIAWTIIGFGIDAVYMQRNTKMPYWETSAFVVTIAQGVVAGLVLILAGPICARIFNIPDIAPIMLIVGLSLPIVSMSIVSGAKIYSRMQFRWTAGYNVVEIIGTQSLIIIFALMKLGPYAFFLPIPIMFTFRAIVYFFKAPVVFKYRARMRQIIILMRKGGLEFTSRVFAVLIDQGDYMMLGLLSTSQEVGFYFFAFRLAAMPVRVIANSLHGVLFSVLARINTDRERQTIAALKSAQVLSAIATPICFIQIAVAAPLFAIFFGHAWDRSILLFQVLSVGLPAEAIATVSRAHLNASGEYRRSMIYSAINATVFFCMVSLGAYVKASLGVACAVSAFYIVVQTTIFFRVFPPGSGLVGYLRNIFLWPMVLSAVSAGAGMLAGVLTHPLGNDILQAAWVGAVSAVTYLSLIWRLQRPMFDELLGIGAKLLRRNRAPDPVADPAAAEHPL